MSVKAKLSLAVAVVVAGVAYLSLLGFQSAKTYYLSVDQALSQRDSLGQQALRVHGRVAAGSVHWDPAQVTLKFHMQGQNQQTLPVIYRGVKPDLLQDQVDVVVEGNLQGNVLVADRVMVKCPSKYQAAAETSS